MSTKNSWNDELSLTKQRYRLKKHYNLIQHKTTNPINSGITFSRLNMSSDVKINKIYTFVCRYITSAINHGQDHLVTSATYIIYLSNLLRLPKIFCFST